MPIYNTVQFISALNDPEINRRFVMIMKHLRNPNKPMVLRFDPDFYRALYPEFAHKTDKELIRYYYDEGIETRPLCSKDAMLRLGYESVEEVRDAMTNRDITTLLGKATTVVQEPTHVEKPTLVIICHLGNPDLADDLLKDVLKMIASLAGSRHKPLLLITGHDEVRGPPEAVVIRTPNYGADIVPYFIGLNYLIRRGIEPNYILKMHTKGDEPTLLAMVDAFLPRLAKQLDTMDAHPEYDIAGSHHLIMPNFHVKELLGRKYANPGMQFVAGSSFLARYGTQKSIVSQHANCIKQAMFLGQYISGWMFDKNSPTHALERIIGGFESQARQLKMVAANSLI